MNLASAYRIPDLDELEAMRPRKGDIVCHGEDELFTVLEIGMRYLVCQPVGKPSADKLLFKHHEVCKWTPPDEPQPDKKPLDLTQTFSHLGPRD